MADYTPPTENLPIFDKLVFLSGDNYITQSQADKRYLKYPNAQGTEYLQAIVVNGTATMNSLLTMSNLTSSTNRKISSSYYVISDSSINGSINSTAQIYSQGANTYIQNDVFNSTTTLVVKDNSGNAVYPIVAGNTTTTLNTNTTIAPNKILTFTSGTGYIYQPYVSGDTTTKNTFRLSQIVWNSNTPTGTGTSVEIYDDINGRGFFLAPNCAGGGLGATNRTNDSCITSRGTVNTNTLTLSNYNNNFRNGLRIYTTDTNNCGLTLQCGQHNPADYTEFAMNYNRGTTPATATTTFNNVINFNPTTPFAIESTRRKLIGLGTLSFTDILNGSSTGSITSSIYTDSTLVNSLNGMYYDCGINSGFHQFSCRDGSGTVSTPVYYGYNITSVSNTFIVRSSTIPSNRFDILTDASNNTNIRARTTTASALALININCDFTNAGGTPTNNAVLTFAPTHVELKRPLKFGYLTQPNDISQLGYYESYTISSITIPSNASVRNLGNFAINSTGTFNIEVSIGLVGSASHNLTSCVFGCSNDATSLPTLTTPSFYSSSLIGHNTISLSTTTESYLKMNFNCDFASATNTVYINYLLTFSGGGNTTINCVVRSTRIG